MSINKTVLAVAITLAMAALICALFEARQAYTERATIRSLRVERERAQERVSALETKVRKLEAGQINARVASAGISTASRTTVISAATNSAPPVPEKLSSVLQPSNPLGSLYALRASSEAMEAWLKAERSGLDLQLGPLFINLGLSTEQEERFKSILLEKFQAVADIMSTAQSQNLAMSDSAIKASLKEATDKTENELRALLGKDGYEKLRYFGSTNNVRELVRSVASDSSFTGTPLNAKEAEALVSLIANHSGQNSSGFDLASTDWESVLTEVPKILSPTQATLLRAEIDQTNLRFELDRIAKAAKAARH